MWTAEHQKAFDDIKTLFENNVFLKYANPHKPYILTTDAFDYPCAASSQLNDEGDGKVVCFMSHTLKGS